MTPSYLAFVPWPGFDQSSIHAVAADAGIRTGLDTVLVSPMLIVLAARDCPRLMLDNGAGMIVGTLFERDAACALQCLNPAAAGTIVQTDGQVLIDGYWGAYVAFIADTETGATHILRDPSGGIPCFRVRRSGFDLLMSEPALAIDAGLLKASIDWPGLTHHLLNDQLRTARTCLDHVSERLAGSRLTQTAGGFTEAMLWSPWVFADRAALLLDEDEAVARLRQTVRSCISAWASRFEHIIVTVSGGLDSSIVAAALAEGPTPFTCLTYYTDDPSGDERCYARDLVARLPARLVEMPLDLALVDLRRSGAARFARPVARSFAQAGDDFGLELAKGLSADGFFTGNGGDNIFCYLQSAAPLADRILVEGLGRGSWQTLNDVSLLAQSSLWQVARSALKKLRMNARPYRWHADTRFLAPDTIQQAGPPAGHPWRTMRRDGLPGTSAHIALLLLTQNHQEGERGLTHPLLSPLLSQPIVELCLRIPSWMWCRDGQNRQVARRAFHDVLPPSLFNRQSKGTPDSFIIAIFEANRDLIREMLIDGLLAGHGLLDRGALSRALSGPNVTRDHDYWRLLRLVDAEAWARAWTSRSPTTH